MKNSLRAIQQTRPSIRTAIRWACIFEAAAPKAGNVHPAQAFEDLTFEHFVIAAEIAADHLSDPARSVSDRMLGCVRTTTRTLGTNVNLGIVLLLGPLVSAQEISRSSDGRAAIGQALRQLDGATVFQAINESMAGGLGSASAMDVRDTKGPVDILAAMRAAAGRDRIARQYATDFDDLYENVIPIVRRSIDQRGDISSGIGRAHLCLLAREPDSLIARKNGIDVATQVQNAAQNVDWNDRTSVENFDQWLRRDGHKLNPGTTADLIAASLFVLFREHTAENFIERD